MRFSLVLAGSLALLLAACGEDDDTQVGASCLEPLDDACSPLYEPTYDNLFSRTLQPTCGQAGSSCHATEGASAALVFADPDEAYDRLFGGGGTRVLVVAGDPECSVIMQRLESDDPGFQMPIGGELDPAERCAVQQWIANGAER